MKALDRFYVSLIEFLIIGGLAAMVGLTFTSTAFRFFGYGGIFWAEEVTRYISIWVVFLAAGHGVRYGIHLSVELVSEAATPRLKKALTILSHLMVITFSALLVFYGTKLAISNLAQQSASLRMPMAYVNAAIPVGGLLMIFETLRLLVFSRDHESFDSTF